jgi:23S rRNA pseudouridine1911/1915/1917 synthase
MMEKEKYNPAELDGLDGFDGLDGLADDSPDFPDGADGADENGMFEHFAVTADKGQSLLRIDKFLTHRMEHVSRARIQAAAEGGNIIVNGVPVRSNYKVKPLDHVKIVMPYPRREVEIIPEDIPLNIVYEDNDVLVVDKPAGLVVHPGHGNYSGTLVNALAWHFRTAGMTELNDARAGLVHRIDKNTSGLLVVAKNPETHTHLAKQFFDHTVTRRYEALVWGNFDDNSGTITGNIGRSHNDRLKMAVFPGADELPPGVEPEGKRAVTHWRVIRRYGYVTMLELRLETGRTHQIRVHMAHEGHPLFNDERYGGDKILKGTTFSKYRQFIENNFTTMPRHALHARSLGFIHPRTRAEMYFESPLPDDFTALLSRWETYTAAKDTFEE